MFQRLLLQKSSFLVLETKVLFSSALAHFFKVMVLVLILPVRVLVLVLRAQGLGLGLGLASQGLGLGLASYSLDNKPDKFFFYRHIISF